MDRQGPLQLFTREPAPREETELGQLSLSGSALTPSSVAPGTTYVQAPLEAQGRGFRYAHYLMLYFAEVSGGNSWPPVLRAKRAGGADSAVAGGKDIQIPLR